MRRDVVPANQHKGANVQAIYLYALAIGAGVSVATQQVLNGSQAQACYWAS